MYFFILSYLLSFLILKFSFIKPSPKNIFRNSFLFNMLFLTIVNYTLYKKTDLMSRNLLLCNSHSPNQFHYIFHHPLQQDNPCCNIQIGIFIFHSNSKFPLCDIFHSMRNHKPEIYRTSIYHHRMIKKGCNDMAFQQFPDSPGPTASGTVIARPFMNHARRQLHVNFKNLPCRCQNQKHQK